MTQMPFVAAVNETLSAETNPTEHLPFNYVPTGWVGITFITLFVITTGGCIPPEPFPRVTYSLLVGHLFEAMYFGIWYMIPTLGLCGFCEVLGWAGRYWGHLSPHDGNAFLMQSVRFAGVGI
jgi:hypothetical protein